MTFVCDVKVKIPAQPTEGWTGHPWVYRLLRLLARATRQILYDPNGSRFALMSGQSVQQYYLPLVAGLQAVYDSTGLKYYRHADWLGSSRLQIDASGNLLGGMAYAPYGETYDETGSPERGFTGQTQDIIKGTTGIYDFLFRQQASNQGRWMVPDPAGLAAVDITNPQTWNRYAYVGNNPLSSIDPLGLDNDCGGPCTPQLFSYGNCYAVITYHSETAPWGGTYDTPAFNSFCHGSGSVRSPGPLWTVVDWDDVHGTGPKRNCNLTPFLCYKKPATTVPGNGSTTDKVSAYNPTVVQRFLDNVNSWMIEHQKQLDIFSCLVAPGAVNDIVDLATYGPNAPPADNSDGGTGGGPMWVNTQLNSRNGGYSLSNPPTGAAMANAGAVAVDWANSAAPCVMRQK